MGFFSDALDKAGSYLNPYAYVTGDSYLHRLSRGPKPAPPGQIDTRETIIPRSSARQVVSDLINPIYHTEAARAYGNIFDNAYQNLGQPLRDSPREVNGNVVGDRDKIYVAGTRSLASAFADRVFEKTGSLPTEDQVRQFVAQTLTPDFAEKFILGIPPDQLTSRADQYLQGNPDALTNPGTKSAEEQRLQGLITQLDKIYNTGRESFVKSYDEDVYGPGKERMVNDLAGQGMLTNPNSRISLGRLEANRGRDISSGLTTLEGERARGNIDLSKTIEDLLQKNRDRSQGAYQFNQTFNAGRDDAAYERGLRRKELELAGQLGRERADASKPGLLDYLNTAANLGGTVLAGKAAFSKPAKPPVPPIK